MIREDAENFYSIELTIVEFETYEISHNLNSNNIGYSLHLLRDGLEADLPELYSKNDIKSGYEVSYKDQNTLVITTHHLGLNAGQCSIQIFKLDY